jgi:hypothetical protein
MAMSKLGLEIVSEENVYNQLCKEELFKLGKNGLFRLNELPLVVSKLIRLKNARLRKKVR